jgi:hypothetical protein
VRASDTEAAHAHAAAPNRQPAVELVGNIMPARRAPPRCSVGTGETDRALSPPMARTKPPRVQNKLVSTARSARSRRLPAAARWRLAWRAARHGTARPTTWRRTATGDTDDVGRGCGVACYVRHART